MALILKNKAIIFTDGRYKLQVRQQTDPHIFEYEDLITCPPSQWLEKMENNFLLALIHGSTPLPLQMH